MPRPLVPIQTAVLRAPPHKREAWVEKQVQAGVDVIISHPKKVETGIDLLDFPTIVWMSPHYSVYTVLQASRRSWRIGQTKPVKVIFFAYADTIQEQALYLVAAKVAATLRVNGATVADDSLAELDGITGNDIVATLARIVTGDSEVSTQSLQQAFAEANVGLRQANTIIGDYEMVADEPEPELLTGEEAQVIIDATLTRQANPRQTLTADRLDVFERVQKAQIVADSAPVGQQSSLFNGNGRSGNGKAIPSPTTTNGHHNGRHANPLQLNDNDDRSEVEVENVRPPVPRPRLFV